MHEYNDTNEINIHISVERMVWISLFVNNWICHISKTFWVRDHAGGSSYTMKSNTNYPLKLWRNKDIWYVVNIIVIYLHTTYSWCVNIFYFISHEKGLAWAEQRCYVIGTRTHTRTHHARTHTHQRDTMLSQSFIYSIYSMEVRYCQVNNGTE